MCVYLTPAGWRERLVINRCASNTFPSPCQLQQSCCCASFPFIFLSLPLALSNLISMTCVLASNCHWCPVIGQVRQVSEEEPPCVCKVGASDHFTRPCTWIQCAHTCRLCELLCNTSGRRQVLSYRQFTATLPDRRRIVRTFTLPRRPPPPPCARHALAQPSLALAL